MTAIGDAVRKVLLDNAAISALVGNRIYTLILPQNPILPAIVFNKLGETIITDSDIAGLGRVFKADFQFESWSDSKSKSDNLAEKIRLCLQGYSGISLTVKIYGVIFAFESDNFESEINNYRIISRYEIIYKRV